MEVSNKKVSTVHRVKSFWRNFTLIFKRIELYKLSGNPHRGDSVGLCAPEELLQDPAGHGVREEDVHRYSIG